MKGKQLVLLLVVVGVLVGAWLSHSKSQETAWSGAARETGKVLDFQLNDAARFTIKTGSAELNLVKKDEIWTVQERANYPANFEQVSRILRRLWELKPVQEVKVGESQLSRLQLVEPGKGDDAGTLVKFTAADGKDISTLILGKKHMRKSEGGGLSFGGGDAGFPTGRYVKPGNSSKVSLVSEVLDDVEPKPESWISKDFITVETPRSISVSGPENWSLTRESALTEWQMMDLKPDEKFEPGKAVALSNPLSSVSIADVLGSEVKNEPVTTALIETFDGFRYEIGIGKEEGANVAVFVKVSGTFPKERVPGKDEKPEDKTRLDGEFPAKLKKLEEKLAKEKKVEGWGYLIPKLQLDTLLRKRSSWMAEKPKTPEPVKTEEAPKGVDGVKAPAPVEPAKETESKVEPAKPAETPKAESQKEQEAPKPAE